MPPKVFEHKWVFLKHSEVVVRLSVMQCYNSVECWYENANGKTYDPFYVHWCKNLLIDRLNREFSYGYTNQKEILVVFTKKLLKRYY